jgi:hypothetical protein
VARGEKLARSITSGEVSKDGDGELLRKFILKMEKHSGPVDENERVRFVAAIMNSMKDFGCTE